MKARKQRPVRASVPRESVTWWRGGATIATGSPPPITKAATLIGIDYNKNGLEKALYAAGLLRFQTRLDCRPVLA